MPSSGAVVNPDSGLIRGWGVG